MAETATAEKFCKAKVKNEFGEQVPCGTRLKGECRNRKNHVGKYKTGFCSNGFCEGKSVRSEATGRPMKHCTEWRTCGCTCHSDMDKLFIMTRKERTFRDMSGYEPEHNPYYMPSIEERAQMHASQRSGAKEVEVIQSPRPELVPITIKREFNETATGRQGRGQLEYRVKEFCDEYLLTKDQTPATPKYVAETIAKKYNIPAPSQGAVDAVFKRWDALGFGMIAKRPTRFIGYTPMGVKMGLDAMKLAAKQKERSEQAQAGRTLRSKRRD